MLNLPVLDFSALWRGLRCPRQLRQIIDNSPCFNPKLFGAEELMQASLYPPEIREGSGAERLDWLFSRHQESQVQTLAAGLFTSQKVIGGESLWEIEGDSLREMGWIGAAACRRQKPLQVHKDNWFQLLPGLPGVARPGFLEQFLWVRPDYLLQETATSWIMLLVRSGSRVKDSYIAEAGFIQAVLARKGIAVSQCLLLCPDENFQCPSGHGSGGDMVRPAEFFVLHSLNHPIKHQREPVLDSIPRLMAAVQANLSCSQQRTCPLCSRELPPWPEHSIHTLHRGGKAVDLLESQGIIDLADIGRASPAARAEMKDRHHIQINSIRQNLPHVDRSALRSFLNGIAYPLFLIDFETTSQAIPPLPGVRPWEHVPFMFSAVKVAGRPDLETPDQLETTVWLMDPAQSREVQLDGLCQALVGAAAGCRSVLAYGAALENHLLGRLAQLFPGQGKRLGELRSSLIDLQLPFQQFHYYHPRQYGKLSLKRVLPLFSQDSHQGLELQGGGEANLSFFCMANPLAVPADIRGGFQGAAALARLDDLRAYCAMDTRGLVSILSALYALAE